MNTESHLYQTAQNISPWRLIMFWNWFLRKKLKRWPLEGIVAFVVVQCPIYNESYCEGHDKWIFLCLLWQCWKCWNTLGGPESTPGKERKGSSALRSTVLDHTDSHTVRGVGGAETHTRPAKRWMTQCNHLFILEAERESAGGCLTIPHLSVTPTAV